MVAEIKAMVYSVDSIPNDKDIGKLYRLVDINQDDIWLEEVEEKEKHDKLLLEKLKHEERFHG